MAPSKQKAGTPMLYRFADARDIGGNNRQTRAHGFQNGDGEPLVMGSQYKKMGLSQALGHILAFPPEINPVADVKVAGQLLTCRTQRSISNQLQLPGKVTQASQCPQHQCMVFLRAEASHHDEAYSFPFVCQRAGPQPWRSIRNPIIDRNHPFRFNNTMAQSKLAVILGYGDDLIGQWRYQALSYFEKPSLGIVNSLSECPAVGGKNYGHSQTPRNQPPYPSSF